MKSFKVSRLFLSAMEVFIAFICFISVASGNEVLSSKNQLKIKNAASFPLKVIWSELNVQNYLLSINQTTVEGIFLHPEVAERKIVAISVIGSKQTDSKLLLDFCLKLLYANVSCLISLMSH